MTNEEALNQINSTNPFMQGSNKQEEYFDMIRKAIEKQIPKKPNLWCGKIITCPNCLRAISQTEALDVHCKYCGQFIDWSDIDG